MSATFPSGDRVGRPSGRAGVQLKNGRWNELLSALMLAALFLVVSPRFARAEHFDIKLVAAGADGVTQEAYADQSPPAFGLNPRPVLKARAGNAITVQFIMTNVYPHGTAKGAGVHYYVVREQDIGQKSLPPLANPVAEGTLTFDLKPKARIGVREHFVIHDPGIYLLRVESARTQRDHEHFSAIDLQIE